MCSKFGINYEWLKFGKADDTSKDENIRNKSLDNFYNVIRIFEDKFSELNNDELSKYTNSAFYALSLIFDTYTNSAFYALSLIFDTYTNRDKEIKETQELFYTIMGNKF